MAASGTSASTRPLALAALFIGAAGISLSPIFVRLADVGPVASAFWRTALAVPFLAMLPWLLGGANAGSANANGIRARRLLPGTPRAWWMLALAGMFFAGDLGVWHVSIGMTSVANATLFPNLAPVIVTLVAWLAFGERITRLFVAGLALALIGAVIIVGDSLRVSHGQVAGDLLAFLAAFFYAGYLLTVSRLRHHAGVATIMTFSSAFSALPLGLLALAQGTPLLASSAAGWAALVGLALVSQVIGQGLIAHALAHLPVSFSSVGLLLQPALAALFGWLLLGEALNGPQAAGMLVILTGIWLARLGSWMR